MPFDTTYHDEEPTRAEIDALKGPVLLEFGANWCGYCQSIQAELEQQLQQYPELRHIKIADGRGKPLGRSFRVKLWPNLVFLRDGQVIAQMARPTPEEIRAGLEALAGG
jgi:thioredoxin 1